jgi:two-component system phosphate regulon response regulator PhoB/two-component system alkaline phosphatase synthesis response regulator PhoP
MSIRIAVLDDEPDILRLVELHLKKADFLVDCYEHPRELLDSLTSRNPDLIILDLMLPGADGLEICSALKRDARHRSIPVIMLTAKGRESDKITGLDLGADDYVTKPFSPRELVSRVKAVLRRSGRESASLVALGDLLTIDPDRFEVRVRGEHVPLTAVEFRILHLLASNEGRVFSREKILDHLWGNEKAVLDRTVDVHIKNLRDKLGQAGRLITNIRGVGYKLQA